MSEREPAALRTLVLHCPDWPLVSWGIPGDEPAAVLVANRVVATSAAARSEGVSVGQRRREAQGRCPDLALLDRDRGREVRFFEPIVAALEDLTPRVEVFEPGTLGFPTRGPARYFGGESALVGQVVEAARPVVPSRGRLQVAVADGGFATRLAAALLAVERPCLLAEGSTPAFLADQSVNVLGMPELSSVLERLGLRSLGQFAALDAGDVVGRFGREGAVAHRLARGFDDHPPDLRRPAPELTVEQVFEPPTNRLDVCAHAAWELAESLGSTLGAAGLACVRVGIEVESSDGHTAMRLWRHGGVLTPAVMAERARWQLEGWIRALPSNPAAIDPAAIDSALSPDDVHGLVRLRLIPDEVVPAVGRQLGLWGGRSERADEITRVVGRVQALLGSDSVTVPEWRGGRGPSEQLVLVPAAAVDLGVDRPATASEWVTEPWPGRLPNPSPARVYAEPATVDLLDAFDQSVSVSSRGEISDVPAIFVLDRGRRRRVLDWAGPWPAEERWWDPLHQRRRARIQVILDDQSAHLLVVEHGQWFLEATYD